MPLPPLFIRGKLLEVNLILSVVSYNWQRSHRHLQPALHPAELATGGKWTYNRQCEHDYCVELILVDETICKKLISLHKKMILAYFLWGNLLLRGEVQIDAINSYFDNFQGSLHIKSVSMPLNINVVFLIFSFHFVSFHLDYLNDPQSLCPEKHGDLKIL